MAAVTAEKKMSKAGARKAKGVQERIAGAIRLLRRGAISMAGKALESKGLGDLENPHDLGAATEEAPGEEAGHQ